MKGYLDNNIFNGHKQHEKLKRHAPHRKITLLCCCLIVMLLAIGLTACDLPFGSNRQTNSQAWSLILVNKWNPIPDNYQIEVTELANGQTVDTRIYPALQEMFDTARSNGVYPVVASGYRTTEKQQRLLDEKIAAFKAQGYSAKDAKTQAETWVAAPGTSEHELGISVDINADGIHSTGEEVYKWLNQNSYKFGFIHRYPADKTDITGVANEPWHYRYVGVDAATEIYEQGICLEEYLINHPLQRSGIF